VPTVPLVDQQSAVLRQQIGHLVSVTSLYAGVDGDSRVRTVLSNGCTVMTAQILVYVVVHISYYHSCLVI
jgi:hypothetical protein